jgi:hypothetical protein
VTKKKLIKFRKILQDSNGKTANIRFASKPNRRKAVIITCALSSMILIGAVGNFIPKPNVVQAANIEGIGVGIYWNQNCTNKTLTLNWGNMTPNSENTLEVFIRNEGNSKVSLYLSTTEWNPKAASNYIQLEWNYSNQILSTGQIIPISLTLTVSPEIGGVSDFTYNTIITATNSG